MPKVLAGDEELGLLAVIGGTGLDWRGGDSPFSDACEEMVTTRWGVARVTRARLNSAERQCEIVFLHRHAPEVGAHIPPHRINYRANVAALKKLGVTAILASTAVGAIRADWKPGTLVLLDDFIDTTSCRDKTFFDDRAVHIDVSEPYCRRLREMLLYHASQLGLEIQACGTYLCADGPRFETPAEIRAFRGMGADVVGMTGVPEVVLAREANISYAGVSVVTNAAAGIASRPLTQDEVLETMARALPRLSQLFLETAGAYRDDVSTPSRRVTAEFGMPSVC